MAKAKSKTLIYLAHDNLNRNKGALKGANPETHAIVFVESKRMLSSTKWNKQRLFFLLSAAKHFAAELSREGFEVHFLEAENTHTGILQIAEDFKEVIAAEPSSYKLTKSLQAIGLRFVTNDFFLTSRTDFTNWASAQKSLKLENFYRWQRNRLDILMENGEPIGGRWNYDDENRNPPPKEPYPWPNYLEHQRDQIDLDVLSQIESLNTSGSVSDLSWGTTRASALLQLKFFLDNSLANFGPFEDAMTTESWAVHHSLLSPYLNVGLLTADEIIKETLKRFAKRDIPIQSCEGFIRQIIGWREYINGIYWYFGEDYRNLNSLKSKRKLLPLFDDSSRTNMRCVKETIQDISERGWVHHIPRLMILSNLAALADIEPQDILDWMRTNFIDAADWVMVPNVIGMSMHADGGKMSTKPYIAGGSYISRMSNYCKGCSYNPKTRSDADSCPFTTLYWHYLNRNHEVFKKNHRMFQQLNGLKKLADLPETIRRGDLVIKLLEKGEI
jgi:deoxyribodipyrimidine photolyase-related protein